MTGTSRLHHDLNLFFLFHRFPESRDNWGTLYPPEDKDPPEFGEEPYREEQASYPTNTQYGLQGTPWKF